MRLTAVFVALAVVVAPSVLAENSAAPDAPTTTITRTLIEATSTEYVLRSPSTPLPTNTGVDSATNTTTAAPEQFTGAASIEQSSLFVVALAGAGAAVVAFGVL